MTSKAPFDFDESKACRNCLLPEPLARLNEEGICHACLSYHRPVLKGIDALKEEIEERRGDGFYDTLAAISGGRDSMYGLYAAKKILRFRVLAFHYNNEFVHEQALANMKSACERLGVDLVSIASKRNLCHKIVADQIRLASQFGPGVLEIHLCGPCNVGGFLAAKRTALQNGIRTILLGNSDEEKVPEYIKIGRPVPARKKILNPAAPFFFRGQLNKFLQRLEFSSSFREIVNFRFSPRNEDPQSLKMGSIKVLPVYNYIQWDRRKIVETIERELGWKKPEDQASSWRFDCRLIELVNYLWFKACGYPKVFFGYVQMIRSGTMTKEEALEQLRAKNWAELSPATEHFLLHELNVEKKYLDRIKSY